MIRASVMSRTLVRLFGVFLLLTVGLTTLGAWSFRRQFAVASAWLPSRLSALESSSIDKEHAALQAIMTGTSPYRSYKYLYVRVFGDGTVEYHNTREIDLTKPIPLVTKKLAQEDVTELMTLLRLPSIQKLSGTFEREDMGDVREALDVEIYRDSEVQKLSLVNFHNDRNTPGKPPYTVETVRLGCVIDRLAERAKSSDWQRGECKNLPKVN